MTKLKMALGLCHCIFVVALVFVIVVLTDNSMLKEVLAQVEGDNDQVILSTTDAGVFVGVKKSVELDPNEVQRNYFAFKGISYAKPPIGPLRWKAPVPVDVKMPRGNGTENKSACPQWSVSQKKAIGSEDCLHLSVFTPYIPKTIIRPPLVGNLTHWTVSNPNFLPVLVFIHGGEFLVDSSALYDPGQFMKENVVLVTFNYRIGLLGFLSNGDESLSGNYGLLDQIEALRWIQSHIHRFGGNPSRVTIFGAVDYMLISPMAKDLFQAAILIPMSTSILSPFPGNIQDNPIELFDDVAKHQRCSLESVDETIFCLESKGSTELIESQRKLLTFSSFPKRLAPVVDKWEEEPVLPESPDHLFENGHFAKVPIMIGVSAYEGFNHFAEFYFRMHPDNFKNVQNVRNQLYKTIKLILGESEDSTQYDRIFESIWRYYLSGIRNLTEEADRATSQIFRLFGDLTVYSGQRKLLRALSTSENISVYNYVFNHSIQYFPEYLDKKLYEFKQKYDYDSNDSLFEWNVAPWKELFYLFEHFQTYNKTNRSSKDMDDDANISDFLGKMWISFAKYGSPKQAISKMENFTKWQKIGENNINYYDIRAEPYPMNLDYRKAEAQFWLNTLPQIRHLSDKINELEEYPFWFWLFAGLFLLFLLLSAILLAFILCYKAIEERKQREDNVVILHHHRM